MAGCLMRQNSRAGIKMRVCQASVGGARMIRENLLMRWVWVLVLLGAVAVPVYAAKHVTAAQMEKEVNALSSSKKSDSDIATQIGWMELSERVSEAEMARLLPRFKTGSQAALALRLLADRAEFLDLPSSDVPTIAAPDEASQAKILEAARGKVLASLPALPNFLATRTTIRFDDSAHLLKENTWPVRTGLHLVDTSSSEVSLSDEVERQTANKESAAWKNETGISSTGEFGSVLGQMILSDTASYKPSWSHWEDTGLGRAAVFHYEVPRSVSHFEVIGYVPQAGAGGRGGGRRPGQAAAGRANVGLQDMQKIDIKSGYHGSLWIDPETGTILRITMDAEMTRGAPFRRSAILVQYGRVKIGDLNFMVPVRSVALSNTVNEEGALRGDGPTEWLNETLFTGYRRFATTTKIIAGSETPVPQSSGDSK